MIKNIKKLLIYLIIFNYIKYFFIYYYISSYFFSLSVIVFLLDINSINSVLASNKILLDSIYGKKCFSFVSIILLLYKGAYSFFTVSI